MKKRTYHSDISAQRMSDGIDVTYLEKLSLQEEFTSWKLAPKKIDEIMTFASIADNEARSDLAGGYISDERDYTSTFISALSRIINTNSESGISHFSGQLIRQEKLGSKIARFEMFYVDLECGNQPNHLQETGSSCVWFQHAYDFMLKRSNPEKFGTEFSLMKRLLEVTFLYQWSFFTCISSAVR